MIKKLLVLAITSGLASKMYKSWKAKQGTTTGTAGAASVKPAPTRAI